MKKKSPKPAPRTSSKGGSRSRATSAPRKPSPKKPSLLPRSSFPDAPTYYDYLDYHLAFPH